MAYPTDLGWDVLHEMYLAKRRIYDMSTHPAGGYILWLPDTFPRDENALRKGADIVESRTGIRPPYAIIDGDRLEFPARLKT